MNSDHDLEEFCKVIKTEGTVEGGSQKVRLDLKKINNGAAKAAEKDKEEVKVQAQPMKQSKERVVEMPPEIPPAAAVNPLVGPYYAPVQPDMFTMAYANPFMYGQQNYSLLYMIQAAKQTETLRQSDFWMQKLAATAPGQLLMQAQRTIDPAQVISSHVPTSQKHELRLQPEAPALMPASVPSSVPVKTSDPSPPVPLPPSMTAVPATDPVAAFSNAIAVTSATESLLARAGSLPTAPTKPMPQSEHHHIHCEFCGHCTIRHNGHIDFVHDAELHHIAPTGTLIKPN